jgi:hypothetical protein
MKRRRNFVVISTILMVLGSLVTLPVLAGNGNGSNNPNKILGNPYYVLNILGKKDGWDPKGTFDNPDRHTMFVPEDTTGVNLGEDPIGGEVDITNSVVIWMTSGQEFAVIDGDGTDGEASLQVEGGKYYVFLTALGKPGGLADVDGWYYDDEGELGQYCFMLGTVRISRSKGKPQWENATDLFYIDWATVFDMLVTMYMNSGEIYEDAVALALAKLSEYGYNINDNIWIFDFLEILKEVFDDTDYYFWKLTNSGLKHIQVRFYKA